jgi:hypothetical protein
MTMKIDTSLIEAAKDVAPIVAKYSDEAERERHLSRPVLDAMREAGLLRMMTPVLSAAWRPILSPVLWWSRKSADTIPPPVGRWRTH